MADENEEKELPKVSPDEITVGPVLDAETEHVAGVKTPVIEGIAKMLKKGRRYFGSSGASLTHQVNAPDESSGIKPELAKAGLEGERETTKILRDWMKDKPGVVLVDSVHINTDYKSANLDEEEIPEELDEETGIVDGKDTDHVLLIGNEIVLIDTKRWKKKRRYSISDSGNVLRANRDFPGGRVRMRQAIYLWVEYLHEDAVLNGIVFINSEETSVTRNYNWYKQPFRLLEKDRFIELLDEKWARVSQADRTTINPNLVAQVAMSAIKPHDIYNDVFNTKALRAFRQK